MCSQNTITQNDKKKNFPQGNLPLAHSFNYGNQESHQHPIKVPNGTIEIFYNFFC